MSQASGDGGTSVSLSNLEHDELVDARVSPSGSLENLSQREVAQLLSAGHGGVYQLFRRCALAVLSSGLHTDESGALFRLLEPLAKHKVSMTRIESRPSRRKKWDYVFFLDINGHAEDPHVAKALAALKKRASLFRVLGSYPRAVS